MTKMLSGIKCFYAGSILALWIFSITILILAPAIRDSLSDIALVTEGTAIGDFYLKTFFPVIFPILITVSCFLFVIGCVGCCGVFNKSHTLLGWFFFTLLVTFCVELSAGIWRIIEYDLSYNTTDLIQLQKNIDLYTAGENMPAWFKDAWIKIHRKFDCCGVISYKDWISKNWEMLRTCCSSTNSSDPCSAVSILVTSGCGNDIFAFLNSSKYMNSMPYITGLMGLVQVLAMILTLKIWLVFCLKAKEKSVDTNYSQPLRHSCRHNERQFYRIEMENKDGTSCYVTPLMTCTDNRVSQHLSLHEKTSCSNQITSSDMNQSDDVIDTANLNVSSRFGRHNQTRKSRTRSGKYRNSQKVSRVDIQSLQRRAYASSNVIGQSSLQSRSEMCTCSFGRQRDKVTSKKQCTSVRNKQPSTAHVDRNSGQRSLNLTQCETQAHLTNTQNCNLFDSSSSHSRSAKNSCSVSALKMESNHQTISNLKDNSTNSQKSLTSNNSSVKLKKENCLRTSQITA